MYPILQSIFADKTGGETFKCFCLWHFFYIFLTLAVVVVLALKFRNKEQSSKEKVIKTLVGIAFGLYIADFFLMPFAYGEIDIDKLPFHACTLMCVASFFSNYHKSLGKYRVHFALLGFISNIMYLIYPAGVMWYEISPFSYRAVQTLLFHSVMTAYGMVVLLLDKEGLNIRRCYRDVAILGVLTLWSMIGNAFYSGSAGEYSHDFNWFFVKYDPFSVLPTDISRYILPELNIAVFFGIEIIIYLIFIAVKKKKEH